MQQIGLLDAADSIILSFEDHSVDSSFEHALGLLEAAHSVYVRRSTLNNLASRLQGLLRNDPLGDANSGLAITQGVLDAMSANLRRLPPEWTIIDFDRWITEGGLYRKQILHALDLEIDIDPAISLAGNGSSFSGRERIPTPEDLTSRLTSVSWPDDLVNLLLRPRNIGLLTPAEVEFLLEVPTSPPARDPHPP